MSNLRPFQTHVAELLLSGKNVILQAPTGSGKTRAALLPLLNRIDGVRTDFPQKCIYAVPMRILATQFERAWRELILRNGRSERLPVSILTGEQPNDTQFEAGLTFATIDQVLSSYLMTPYSLSRRLANLNAGAVAASYLVFDEFHLFDPTSTLPTTLEMLYQLRGVTPFLLMTATFSQTMLDRLAEKLDAVVYPRTQPERNEFAKLASQQKTRRYHTCDAVLSADEVLNLHREHRQRTLVVCNAVDRARALYQEVSKQHEGQTLLLHSRFLQADRQRIETAIRQAYHKDAVKDADMIVISTQAVEVGLDITCRSLITELAPANAIIQRAGRCARYQGSEGDVYIYRQTYDPRDGEILDLTEKVNPYKGQEREFEKTWEAFAACSGQEFDFQTEQNVLSAVHDERDQQIIAAIGIERSTHRQRMFQVMRGAGDEASALIRNVAAYRVTIHSNWRTLLDDPLSYESFSVPDVVLYAVVSELASQSLIDDVDPIVALIEQSKDRRATDEENRVIYEHRYVNTANDVYGASLIVFHPDVASYSDELGLMLGQPGDWQCKRMAKSAQQVGWNRPSYRLESYEDHIAEVWRAFQEVWPEVAGAAARLERDPNLVWTPGSIYQAAALAVILHDTGKLSVNWQRWAKAYQHEKNNDISPGMAAAHTDYDSMNEEDRALQKRIKPGRPNHAAESAYAACQVLASCLNLDLAIAAFSAILRHHTPFADSCDDYQLAKDAANHVALTLSNLAKPDQGLTEMLGFSGPDSLIEPLDPESDPNAYLAYQLIVRALRRADQLGTQRGMQRI